MRRPLAALVLGAVSLAGLVPAAGAGAAELPKLPFIHRKPVLKLACDVVRQDDKPAVACRWSSPSSPEAKNTAADPAGVRPAWKFELHRGGGGAGRTVVYTGPETSFVDTSVEPGSNYGYKVEALNADGRTVARSRAVVVKIPTPADHLRLSCAVEQRADDARRARPAVACKWSPAERDDLAGYRLFKADGTGWRQVVYRGPDTAFLDVKVRPGHRYRYLVQALDHRGDVIGVSDIEEVEVPATDPPVPADPTCRVTDAATNDTPPAVDVVCKPAAPAPKPTSKPDPKPAPLPAPKREPRPEPKPEPTPTTKPRPVLEPKPEPLPAPTPKPAPEPTPLPEPKPAPVPVRMRLACAPQRFATTDTTDAKTTDATIAPTGPVVVCEWATPSELKVASYQLWRADRPEGTKQVVFKSADATRYVDRAVAAGHSYVYVVRALDADGRVIGQSDAVSVSFPATA